MIQQHILAVVQNDLQLICSLRRFLDAHGYPSLTVARNSQEAILYLRGVGIYEDRLRYPIPAAIILDSLNPDGSDLEVLGWLREGAGLSDLPVMILCNEKHSPVHVLCALDPASFLVDRGNFEEIVDALHNCESARQTSVATLA